MTKRIKLRTLLVGGVITLLFLVLIIRVYFVQVAHADFWLGKAREVWATSEPLKAVRGTITDRDGNILAMDAPAYTVSINPNVLHKLNIADKVVERFHAIIGKSVEGLRNDVNAKRDNGEYVINREIHNEGWKMEKELADQIREFRDELREQTGQKDVGITLLDDQKRYYPKQNMASHLLGYVQKNDSAVYGIESLYDEALRGQDGYIKYEKDGKRVQLADGEVEYKPAVDGKNLRLTINTEIQYYVEEAIKESYQKYQPKSITAIAADPNTMEILGMASYPNFNPNIYWETKDQAAFYNHPVKQLIEPGSTFKIVTLAAAVQEGLFNPDDTYVSGSIKVPGATLRDVKRGGWGTISYLQGLKYSSNVAFVKLGYEKLGAEKFKNYITNFGFGEKTGIEQPGELKGRIDFNWPSEVATATYGQGKVQVTPIQQVAAVAAVANGGRLMEPHLVKQIEDPVTKTTQVIQPKVVRQVISEETSKKVGEYLEQVVSDGTGRNAQIEGYRIAGKTGTAQKVSGGKGYSENKFIVSFIGYAPVENPKIVVYVVVDEPNDPNAGGGKVAAPVFQSIVEKSLRHLGVMPSVQPDQQEGQGRRKSVTLPNVVSMKLTQATNEMQKRALNFEIVGKGKTVLQQIPKAGTTVPGTQRIYLITEERKQMAIPDMHKLPLRDVLEVCSLLDVRCVTEGEGFVVSQVQETQGKETVLKLKLEPPEGIPEKEQPEDNQQDGESANTGHGDDPANVENADPQNSGTNKPDGHDHGETAGELPG
ncbi:penicillin-binding transpeptidase domain-containing protein [Paenibacillus sp. GCM10012307]|uniref:PASTA domain-containing protein n=1 Tax=Paenibacillus roseus TaxID=2798579 RepID=A0A934J1N1_9BACL|nr:penicillin-binding transpeptidase domain-containing protein [Paenibacillus roseus]MBJ6363151.1 PASTA domain-containing protein [Paenibacillus roseus]